MVITAETASEWLQSPEVVEDDAEGPPTPLQRYHAALKGKSPTGGVELPEEMEAEQEAWPTMVTGVQDPSILKGSQPALRALSSALQSPADPHGQGHFHALAVMPDGILISGLTLSDTAAVSECVRRAGEGTEALASELAALVEQGVLGSWVSIQQLLGNHLVVCAHGAKDQRCGKCGPQLEAWARSVSERDTRAAAAPIGEEDSLVVWPSTHVGGHKYAPNAIAYPSGHWFAQVADEEHMVEVLSALRATAQVVLTEAELEEIKAAGQQAGMEPVDWSPPKPGNGSPASAGSEARVQEATAAARCNPHIWRGCSGLRRGQQKEAMRTVATEIIELMSTGDVMAQGPPDSAEIKTFAA